ncbi:DUF6318 family protein [Georgenia faecalis]|uniref:DUF6318 family protein n=1 Tax=Georgenia faecalis TaxID=2483799 RepID=A0ABV9DDE2_9MICO|nr:DUF6318 family protein [Georgenia faecalis]
MVVRSRPHVAVAVLALAGLVVAGCSVEAEPGPTTSSGEPGTSTSASTTTATPAPGPTDWPEPDRPASMDRDDLVGAKAAAQYFIELYPYVYATGNLSEWQAMSHPECAFCTSVVDGVRELHDAGGYAIGPEVTVVEVRGADPVDGNPYFSVDVAVSQGPSRSYSSTGDLTGEASASRNVLLAALERTGAGWQVREIQVEELDENQG